MKVTILGTGYVGLSTGVVLAEIGHDVCCIDVDENKINKLCQGISPIYEPGLEELLTKNVAAGRLHFTSSHYEGIADAEVIILAVGTPQQDDGRADLSYLQQAAKDIATHLVNDCIVVIKSTVPVGTNDEIKRIIEANCHDGVLIRMVSNPEFLRQGSAIKDTMKADRVIIGFENQEAGMKIKEMYESLNVPFVMTSIRSAEMIKYASNAFLATKISFINGIANLCELVGADVLDVAKGMGLDQRIGAHFLQAGIGYGGSCFPKDVKALYHTASQHGADLNILAETMRINEEQRVLLVKKALNRFGDLTGKKIAMLGLAFKPDTDDMREAPSILLAKRLSRLGVDVVAYDPVATSNARKVIGDIITYVDSIDEAVTGADAIFIVTEWEDIKRLDLASLGEKMNQVILFDGRNCFDEAQLRTCKNIEYYSVGRPPVIT
ncbi:UDP-glucose/GDP-mannose dehydrogenase family protein [Bacillus sp. B15-48]|uniref:UDP-glucose dehydrogenase family protein n=1 Tax=Bacillus sp. B15-48 TaxID=1548601 RepID=UPI00193F5BB7|nr:UDP-glucose/GDP-mannose dehydrogenase family protein [Bacillus sp. B15-48]MBM4762957.1 nucleotide sugar dehydrogenase [Bacillus sp. B15-48]